jgi:hypothetical protein
MFKKSVCNLCCAVIVCIGIANAPSVDGMNKAESEVLINPYHGEKLLEQTRRLSPSTSVEDNDGMESGGSYQDSFSESDEFDEHDAIAIAYDEYCDGGFYVVKWDRVNALALYL